MIRYPADFAWPECVAAIEAAGISLVIENRAGKAVAMFDEKTAQAIIDAYPVAAAAAWKADQVSAYAKALRDAQTAAISLGEVTTWATKAAEAKAFEASGKDTDAESLQKEAAARGIPLADLAAKVASKSAAFADREAQIAGVEGKHRDVIKSLQDFQAIAEYDFSGGWPGSE